MDLKPSQDRRYLREEQYADARHLDARIDLHLRFSRNREGWHPWVRRHLELPAAARILEVGCGSGKLWTEGRGEEPLPGRLFLSDLSPGMLRDARAALPSNGAAVLLADAQALPFRPGAFDAVIANHMLYHLPDREQGLAEMARVLGPEGVLFAATNGRDHLRELDELLRWAGGGSTSVGSVAEAFGLETGEAQLRRWFGDVRLHRYADALEVTEAEPLLAYIRSVQSGSRLAPPAWDRLSARIQEEMARQGAVHVTKASGLFVATHPLGRPS